MPCGITDKEVTSIRQELLASTKTDHPTEKQEGGEPSHGRVVGGPPVLVGSETLKVLSTSVQGRGHSADATNPSWQAPPDVFFSDAVLRFSRAFKEKMQYDEMQVLNCRDALQVVDSTRGL